ncbi:hypothetical protein JG687_00010946 [Phytophthora cactorum]|uniref:Uncharacterized protein n=1 Tax=Phytophthora cactorum TaxID=29920 RepID=A0A8T1U7Q1_9STRA|nr:hypothetical protein PC120_g17203 [Phytophthora cactorum]KAG3051834.1 hypothetical protein PC121_g17630 [Phytophthora cactorum]KAG3164358.1 hypothetical protein PC128_g20168 [Phytophthora cactorum]KAG6955821.1 hypothetical protein JG687_00010946 [Phytophthora cactorum]
MAVTVARISSAVWVRVPMLLWGWEDISSDVSFGLGAKLSNAQNDGGDNSLDDLHLFWDSELVAN